ncbi:dGTP triphosphohydrolase [Lysobacter sp. M2-1]|uniref:dGTP triphosphohydrolase n=1 Tax=Lysobacter sp. M2-1 TaxID=2916839 RepID=UPI001F570784|nr:dNTP triphosphohydrolase [Lysobacter sp. M2-1]
MLAKALNWENLLATDRLDGPDRKKSIHAKIIDHRTDHERDFDRVVFCAPVRRLKDKTQVFPLDMHDGVRTRLTHSIEVSNLARSMGTSISYDVQEIAAVPNSSRNVPALLAAIALTHDLGNPPFGHQGEVAIQQWVASREDEIRALTTKREFKAALFKDFLHFEGNAQGFRILARLQHQDHRSSLRLTASTLRSFMKYPWSSERISDSSDSTKFGFFQSEKNVFEWASAKTGCEGRHPLSYLMEACDDIAYSVLDIEDAVKKELISVADLAVFMGSIEYRDDDRVNELIAQYRDDRDWLSSLTMPGEDGKQVQISNKEIRDSQVDLLRSYAIGLMVSDAIERFKELVIDGMLGKIEKDIAGDFRSAVLMKALKKFAKLRVYKHPDVLKAELQGHRVIPALMDVFWRSVVNHHRGTQSKIDEYVMSLISPNYIRVSKQSEDLKLPLWYRQLQLVCDQVCGMTDSFAIRTYDSLSELGAIR